MVSFSRASFSRTASLVPIFVPEDGSRGPSAAGYVAFAGTTSTGRGSVSAVSVAGSTGSATSARGASAKIAMDKRELLSTAEV